MTTNLYYILAFYGICVAIFLVKKYRDTIFINRMLEKRIKQHEDLLKKEFDSHTKTIFRELTLIDLVEDGISGSLDKELTLTYKKLVEKFIAERLTNSVDISDVLK